MRPKTKVLFMGTPEFSVHILDTIIKANYEVVGVVSTPDKPAGRGRKIHSSAVSVYAKENGLTLLQPPKLKDSSFLEKIKKLQADVFVVVAFRMLPKEVWSIPSEGTFNLHASLLPQYRGAAPINWAIINGEKKSGVTTFLIDEKIDTGNILLKEEVKITPEETAGELHDELMKVGAELVVKTLQKIEDKTISPQQQQDDAILKKAPKLFKENTMINWENPMEQIKNMIRGLNPYPSAWTKITHGGEVKMLKIYKVKTEDKKHDYPIGKIIKENNALAICHKKGYVWIEELQLQGKKRMKIRDFINGFSPGKDTKVLI